ncbi:hypothetical protein SPI_00186 [Niveomyces insectorum RCEF 264]|uniref:Uncharacterized protein n=1 Tax=Niveomyces insectorum RCEF 264 TaxID=1081102 RepID=A0A167ZWT3_9HYPO|nr:hypothetical protein SPI_00186 [Niveomyces insectorum RCEF 264]
MATHPDNTAAPDQHDAPAAAIAVPQPVPTRKFPVFDLIPCAPCLRSTLCDTDPPNQKFAVHCDYSEGPHCLKCTDKNTKCSSFAGLMYGDLAGAIPAGSGIDILERRLSHRHPGPMGKLREEYIYLLDRLCAAELAHRKAFSGKYKKTTAEHKYADAVERARGRAEVLADRTLPDSPWPAAPPRLSPGDPYFSPVAWARDSFHSVVQETIVSLGLPAQELPAWRALLSSEPFVVQESS